FPKCIFFILGNEFCERYSYYGMRTILVLYLKYYLHWDEDTATAVYHAFTVLAYLFPIMGAILADSWWGKYNTILWLSVVYALGMILNTLGAIGTLGDLTVHAVLSSMGLLVIAFGTGGIKPCVSAFGGDQFDDDQENYRKSFFSLFYFAINAGSLVSTFVSPIIRDEVQCFGDDCYALAFGIPAALMVVAIVSFFFGTPFYKRNPPSGNIFFEVPKTIGRAISARSKAPVKDREHWMDYALETTDAKMVRDIKYVLRILVLYIPLPVFWALFDQQGSRWTLQAVRMDGYVGSLHILPDQMQICNPLIIVTLIPLFEVTLYPCLRHFNINFSPLRRMTLGMLLAGLAFIVAALVQMMIDENLTRVPDGNQQTSLRVINSADCDVSISSQLYGWDQEGSGNGGLPIPSTNVWNYFVIQKSKPSIWRQNHHSLFLNRDLFCPKGIQCIGPRPAKPYCSVLAISRFDEFFPFTLQDEQFPQTTDTLEDIIKPGTFTLNYQCTGSIAVATYEFSLSGNEARTINILNNPQTYMLTMYLHNSLPSYRVVTYLPYHHCHYPNIFPVSVAEGYDLNMYTDVYPNDVNIFWMIPQYFIITLGEVFLSVTGLEFSYSQAPPSMKSILQSLWLLTVSIGNIIVLIVAEARLVPNQADEYFLFAGLIFAAALIFIILAIRYKYVDEREFYEGDEDQEV
uniref:Solute carrier family 15 member 2 n=1 Tax=Ciona savignyi TaxID=51511 RepID=H2Y7V3_CIOSA